MSTLDLWTYGSTTWGGEDLVGFEVEALDGSVGSVDEATYDIAGSYLVVDTGPWIFGKKTVLPAGVVERIDRAERKILVNRTKDEIKNAPEFHESRFDSDVFRAEIGRYYGPGGAGYRPALKSTPAGRQSG